MRSQIRVLDEELNRLKRAKEADLSKSLKKLNKSELSKESNELKSMNNVEELKCIREMMIQSFSSS